VADHGRDLELPGSRARANPGGQRMNELKDMAVTAFGGGQYPELKWVARWCLLAVVMACVSITAGVVGLLA
jgi:hypothetical protein